MPTAITPLPRRAASRRRGGIPARRSSEDGPSSAANIVGGAGEGGEGVPAANQKIAQIETSNRRSGSVDGMPLRRSGRCTSREECMGQRECRGDCNDGEWEVSSPLGLAIPAVRARCPHPSHRCVVPPRSRLPARPHLLPARQMSASREECMGQRECRGDCDDGEREVSLHLASRFPPRAPDALAPLIIASFPPRSRPPARPPLLPARQMSASREECMGGKGEPFDASFLCVFFYTKNKLIPQIFFLRAEEDGG